MKKGYLGLCVSIAIGSVVVNSAQAATASDKIKRWPQGVVPYEILPGNASTEHLAAIQEAIVDWNSKTVVNFVQRTSANQNQHPDYIQIVAGTSLCGTFANGWKEGKQDVNIGQGCTLGHTEKSGAHPKRGAIHELGHSLGLEHEQQRYDAASYISLNKCVANDIIFVGNRETGKCGITNLLNMSAQLSPGKATEGWTYGTYDYFSVMHYHLWESALPGIDPETNYFYELFYVPEAKRAQLLYQRYNSPELDIDNYDQFRAAMDARSGLTQQDIEFVNLLYSNSADMRVTMSTTQKYCSYKRFNNGKCAAGGTMQFAVTLSNEGAYDTTGATLDVQFPDDINAADITFDNDNVCNLNSTSKLLSCNAGSLAVFDTFTVTIGAKQPDDAAHDYIASAASTKTDHFMSDNSAKIQYKGGSLGIVSTLVFGLLLLMRRNRA